MERLIKQKTYSFFEDVLLYWSMVSVNWEEEESTELLQNIIEQWVTVHVFSFAGAFLEKYKQIQSVQKSKGLRKKLQNFVLFIYLFIIEVQSSMIKLYHRYYRHVTVT